MKVPVKCVQIVALFLSLLLPTVGAAKDQPSSAYTKGEVDAKINELRCLINQSEQNNRQRALKTAEHIDAFKRFEEINAYLGPLLAAVAGALISAAVLLLLKLYADAKERRQDVSERKRKQIESTLEFSKRFGELLQLQSKLNKAYDAARATQETQNDPPTRRETDEAKIWWWLFFDLLLYEYDFFKQGFIWKERFIEWIKWRWYDFNATGDAAWKTCGMDYRAGWQSWKEKPANRNNRLIIFLDKVHDRARDAAEVEQIVAEETLPPRQEYHLI